jgi:hemerythrin-like domain-containing protein
MSDHRGEPGTVELMIQRDHRILNGLLSRFDRESVARWPVLLKEFGDYLTRHEMAEQEVVYPALRESVSRSHSTVERCSLEEEGLAVRFGVMSAIDSSSQEFRDQLGSYREEFAAHAALEEQHILPMLRAQADFDLVELGSRYDLARMSAPGEPAVLEHRPM